jgi:hypothetical protein
MRFPSRSHITIRRAKRGGPSLPNVPVSSILCFEIWLGPAAGQVRVLLSIRREGLSARQKWGSLDMAEAWHPQTLLAYAMNGQELPAPHGARFAAFRAARFKSQRPSRIT